MDLIPMSAPHWHILLNHFPSIGAVIAVALLIGAFKLKSEDLTRASLLLFVVASLLTIPTFISGAATRWAIQNRPEISEAMILAHQDAALLAFIVLLITGWLSWLTLWQYRRSSRPYPWSLPTIFVLGLLTVYFMIETGSLGGDINHPEILEAEGRTGAIVSGTAAGIGEWIYSVYWLWPVMEAMHFIGMALLFGVVILVAIRVLGIVRHVPFNALHRLLPLGVFGFMTNVITGMLFFVADSGRYIAMTNSFFPKMALIVIGGMALLYFTVFDRPWNLKSGDNASLTAKAIAAAMFFLWAGVIVYGRLLPYLEGG